MCMTTSTTTSGPSPIVCGYSPMIPQLLSTSRIFTQWPTNSPNSTSARSCKYLMCCAPCIHAPNACRRLSVRPSSDYAAFGSGRSQQSDHEHCDVQRDRQRQSYEHRLVRSRMVGLLQLSRKRASHGICILSSSEHRPGLKFLENGRGLADFCFDNCDRDWRRVSNLYDRIYPLKNRL
jgi:hypothetical protein